MFLVFGFLKDEEGFAFKGMEPRAGFAPAACCLRGSRSAGLSYRGAVYSYCSGLEVFKCWFVVFCVSGVFICLNVFFLGNRGYFLWGRQIV